MRYPFLLVGSVCLSLACSLSSAIQSAPVDVGSSDYIPVVAANQLEYIIPAGDYKNLTISFFLKPLMSTEQFKENGILSLRKGDIDLRVFWWQQDQSFAATMITPKDFGINYQDFYRTPGSTSWQPDEWYSVEMEVGEESTSIVLGGKEIRIGKAVFGSSENPLNLLFAGTFLLDDLTVKADGKPLIIDDFNRGLSSGNGGQLTPAGGLIGKSLSLLQTDRGKSVRLSGKPAPDAEGFYTMPTTIVPILQERLEINVDGMAHEPVWNKAAKVTGLLSTSSCRVADLASTFQIMADSSHIYLNFEFEKEKGVPLRTVSPRMRDGNVWDDDAVEFYLMPEGAKGSVTFIGNSNGDIWDANSDARPDNRAGWNGDWDFKVRVEDTHWGGEVSIPFESLGFGLPKEGQKWRLRLFRYKNSGEVAHQGWTLNGFDNIRKEPWIEFSAVKPYFRMEELGQSGDRVSLKGEILNPSDREVSADVIVRSAVQVHPDVKGFMNTDRYGPLTDLYRKKVLLPAYGSARISAEEYKLKDGEEAVLTCRVSYDGQDVFRQGLPIQKSGILSIALEPYTLVREELVAIVTPSGEFRGNLSGLLRVSLKDDDKVLQSMNKDIRGFENAERFVLSTAKLVGGRKYIVEAMVDRDNSQAIVGRQTFTMPSAPVWWTQKVGLKAGFVPEPWTPIRVSEHTVSVTDRDIRLGNSGLPASILIKGKEFLAGPIVLKVGDRRYDPESLGTLNIAPDICSFVSQGQTGGYDVSLMNTMEYDGFMRFDLRIAPDADSIRDVILEIPIKKEHAFLQSNLYELTPWQKDYKERFDFNGFVPPEDEELHFYPLLWLGDDWCGLHWAAESEQHWYPYDNPKSMVIAHDGDSIVLRVNIVSGEMKADSPITYTFSLQPTPVKPFSYKAYLERAPIPTWANNTVEAQAMYLSNQYKIPWDQALDGTAERPIDALHKQGLKAINVGGGWTEIWGYPGTLDEQRVALITRLSSVCRKAGLGVITYLENVMTDSAPEWKDYGHEMISEPRSGFTISVTDDPAGFSYWACNNPVFNDFTAWGIQRMLKDYGTSGVYLDTTVFYAQACCNLMHNHGYVRPDGKVMPTFPIYGPRDLAKRIYNICHGLYLEDGIVVQHWLAIPAWNDLCFHGEGYSMLSARGEGAVNIYNFKNGAFRVDYGLWNFGTYMDMLKPGNVGYRDALAMGIVHGVLPPECSTGSTLQVLRNFTRDITDEDLDWKPYFETEGDVSTGNDLIPASIWIDNKNRRALIAVSNLNATTEEVQVKVDWDKFRLAPVKATQMDCDVYTGDGIKGFGWEKRSPVGIPFAERVIKMSIPAHDYVMILVE